MHNSDFKNQEGNRNAILYILSEMGVQWYQTECLKNMHTNHKFSHKQVAYGFFTFILHAPYSKYLEYIEIRHNMAPIQYSKYKKAFELLSFW